VGESARKKSSARPGRTAKPARAARVASEPARERPAGKAKDEARTLALLWGAQERAGRLGLTVQAIVRTAVKVADEEGFEAVSMRRLAELLEVGTMSLYTHVPGKLELADLMVDAVKGELYKDVDEARLEPGGYRERLRFIADRNKALYERHPWLLDVPLGRPVLGPQAALKYETELRALDGIELTPLELDSMLSLLTLHVQSSARLRVTDRRAQQADGMTEVEWWMNTVPLLKRVMTGQQYPTAARIGKAAGEAMAPGGSSAEHIYRFGLDVICQAVAAMIAQKRNE
jgi:AcrR family transcriptional regulator